MRAGLRTSLLCRTEQQADALGRARINERYLPGVELPRDLRIRALAAAQDQLSHSDLVFLAVPSKTLPEALVDLGGLGVSPRAGIVSLAKGLVPPDGLPATIALEAVFGAERVACVGGPAHAREMVESGAGLVCASRSEALAHDVAEAFQRAGVVCEVSDDPVGVELPALPPPLSHFDESGARGGQRFMKENRPCDSKKHNTRPRPESWTAWLRQ